MIYYKNNNYIVSFIYFNYSLANNNINSHISLETTTRFRFNRTELALFLPVC